MKCAQDMKTDRLWDIVNSALFAAEKNKNHKTPRGRAYIQLADSAHAIYSMQRCEEMTINAKPGTECK